jgi:DNA-binding IclR family transcriptional regulator
MEGLEEDDRDRNFVTALARGLAVLRCYRHGEVTLTNSDFADRTGLPKATISRLTHTLCELGYLVAEQRGGSYRLGPGVLRLGFGVLAGLDIRDRAYQELKTLCQGPNTYITAALGEQHRLDVVYLATVNSREDVTLTLRVGARLPMFRSAMGRAILAEMTEEARERVFRLAREKDPETEAEGRQALDEARAELAEKGFCTGYGSWRRDVNGIAVAVRSMTDGRVYGLNVGGPSFRVKKRQLETLYGPMLHQAAEALSLQPR